MEKIDTKDNQKSKEFKLKSKGFFLTYPQCPATRETVADMLATKGEIAKGLIG